MELSLFGPGVGECAVVHVGAGDWIVVDSCIDPDSGQPAALKYLTDIGVNPATAVKAVIVSHWHNDHIRGVSDVLKAATSAKFICSAAYTSEELLMVIAAKGLERVGKDDDEHEYLKVCRLLKARAPKGQRGVSIGPTFALENTILFERASPAAQVRALSPVSANLTLAVRELAEFVPKKKAPKRRAIAQKPNQLSVVLRVRAGNAHALLGADLETGTNPGAGWNAVVANHDPSHGTGTLFKVPHHGSENAHHDGVWSDMLEDKPVALLAPYLASKKPLPAPEDVERIKRHSNGFFSTTRVSGKKPPTRGSAVDKTMKTAATHRRLAKAKLGHVCVRIDMGAGGEPVIVLHDAAVTLQKRKSA